MHRAINVDKKEFEKINFELASKNHLETYLSREFLLMTKHTKRVKKFAKEKVT